MPLFLGLAGARTGSKGGNGNTRCRHCHGVFEAKKPTIAQYCSGRCRAEASRVRQREAAQDRDKRLQSLVATLAREVGLEVGDTS